MKRKKQISNTYKQVLANIESDKDYLMADEYDRAHESRRSKRERRQSSRSISHKMAWLDSPVERSW